MTSIARKALHVSGEVVLTLLAAGGAACILLVLAAVWFGASVILFSTGSMTPTIPAGSAALVREIPASEVEVGDVVTVDRPDALPITHRVVAIEGTGAVRELTLRGDANPTDDPFPYSVSHVREVIFSVPGIASAIDAAGNPVPLATVTVLMAGLVTWAFWPRREPPGGAAPARSSKRRERMRRSTGARHVGAAAVVVAAALIGVTTTPQPATAATTEHIVQGEVIRLTSILDAEQARNLEPGVESVWIVGVEAITDEPGAIDIDLEFAADEPALTISVAACDVRWTDAGCSSGQRDLLDVTATDVAASHRLDEMSTSEERWLRLSVGLADSGAESIAAGWRDLVVRASGFGESSGIGPGGDGILRKGPPDDRIARTGPPDYGIARTGPPDDGIARTGPPADGIARTGPPADGIARTGLPFAPGALVIAALLLIAAGSAALIRRPRERPDGRNG
ncbi:signal peptidase I [Agromyces albus]|uniref:signal peptidase I n=1 Tax=Agromyces albus TaxID=205332 RepID=UPI0027863E72|nr:signal peptidase I [Agromyces albus]MDQ0574512.1 signal peptidase [Agromyces albus]